MARRRVLRGRTRRRAAARSMARRGQEDDGGEGLQREDDAIERVARRRGGRLNRWRRVSGAQYSGRQVVGEGGVGEGVGLGEEGRQVGKAGWGVGAGGEVRGGLGLGGGREGLIEILVEEVVGEVRREWISHRVCRRASWIGREGG